MRPRKKELGGTGYYPRSVGRMSGEALISGGRSHKNGGFHAHDWTVKRGATLTCLKE